MTGATVERIIFDRKTRQQIGTEQVPVAIGDHVSFKSDYEQSGEVIAVKPIGSDWLLTLRDSDGFGGDYLRYATETQERASDCWAE